MLPAFRSLPFKARVYANLQYIRVRSGNLWNDFWRVNDLKMVRAILAIASVIWGMAAILQPGTFNRPAFSHLTQFLGAWPDAPPRVAEIVWGSAFIVYALGLWLIAVYQPIRDTWPTVVNGLGLVLWVLTAGGTNWAVHSFSPGNAAEWALCGFASLALYRTGFPPKTNG